MRALFVACSLTFFAGFAAAQFSGMGYLENEDIRIGVNLDIGGAITYLSPVDSDENIVNSYDWGRQIQMSFYSGPTPFEPEGTELREFWKFLGWNPIQSGDTYSNKSEVLAYTNDGTTLYVQCRPMHWPLNNFPGECTFETWITLDGNTARVRSKLNNARPDTTQYPARGQELPAVYTNGNYYRLFTYDGQQPYSDGPLRQITKVWDTSKGVAVEGGPWDHWSATENWAALVREDDFGVGIWSPGTYAFKGGFAGTPGAGGPKDAPTGYIAPTRREILDHDIEYSYDYVLIVGDLKAIRSYVYEHANGNVLPDYTFAQDRQSWFLVDCTDAGWPLEGKWRINLSGAQPRLIGPETFWTAQPGDVVVVRGAFDTGVDIATLHWEGRGADGPSRGSTSFDVIADGVMRDYTVNIASGEAYRGVCTRLEIRPSHDGQPERTVTIESIRLSR